MSVSIENNSWDYVQGIIEKEINSAFKLRIPMEDEPKIPRRLRLVPQEIFVSKIIYIDIDGCICTTNYDTKDFRDIEASYINEEPFLDRIECINKLFDEGHYIVYWTARGCKSGLDMTNITKTQLKQWGAKYSELQVGNKPHFDMYICDKSWNSEDFFHRQKLELP